MSQFRAELAPTVLLLSQYKTSLTLMLRTPKFHGHQEVLLRFAAGIDLLHIIVQLMVVSAEAANKIFKECKDLDPKHFHLGFLEIYEGLVEPKEEVHQFIRPKSAFVAIVDRLIRYHGAHKPYRTSWWLENLATTIASVWDQASRIPPTNDLDEKRFTLLYKISLHGIELVSDPPKEVVSAYSELQAHVDGRTQRSLGHRSTPTLGHRKDAIYYVCATT